LWRGCKNQMTDKSRTLKNK